MTIHLRLYPPLTFRQFCPRQEILWAVRELTSFICGKCHYTYHPIDDDTFTLEELQHILTVAQNQNEPAEVISWIEDTIALAT